MADALAGLALWGKAAAFASVVWQSQKVIGMQVGESIHANVNWWGGGSGNGTIAYLEGRLLWTGEGLEAGQQFDIEYEDIVRLEKMKNLFFFDNCLRVVLGPKDTKHWCCDITTRRRDEIFEFLQSRLSRKD